MDPRCWFPQDTNVVLVHNCHLLAISLLFLGLSRNSGFAHLKNDGQSWKWLLHPCFSSILRDPTSKEVKISKSSQSERADMMQSHLFCCLNRLRYFKVLVKCSSCSMFNVQLAALLTNTQQKKVLGKKKKRKSLRICISHLLVGSDFLQAHMTHHMRNLGG